MTITQPETKEQQIARLERDGYIFRDCKGCEKLFEDPNQMAPRHNASEDCESGKRNHCTCDRCW